MVKTRMRYFNNEPKVYEVEMDDNLNYGDESEKALWDMKESLDLPTEEVEIAVASRHKSLKNS